MDGIESVFHDMIKLQSKQSIRNMIVIKASAFCEYETLLALNTSRQSLIS